MSTWQQDANDLFRDARARATETSNIALHQACGRAIEAMVAEGGFVPADLRIYARTVRILYGIPTSRAVSTVADAYVGQ